MHLFFSFFFFILFLLLLSISLLVCPLWSWLKYSIGLIAMKCGSDVHVPGRVLMTVIIPWLSIYCHLQASSEFIKYFGLWPSTCEINGNLISYSFYCHCANKLNYTNEHVEHYICWTSCSKFFICLFKTSSCFIISFHPFYSYVPTHSSSSHAVSSVFTRSPVI